MNWFTVAFVWLSLGAAFAFLVWWESRNEKREAAKRRHPSSQSVATYLVGEPQMPPELRALVIAEIAKAHAERIDEEWAAISRAVGDE